MRDAMYLTLLDEMFSTPSPLKTPNCVPSLRTIIALPISCIPYNCLTLILTRLTTPFPTLSRIASLYSPIAIKRALSVHPHAPPVPATLTPVIVLFSPARSPLFSHLPPLLPSLPLLPFLFYLSRLVLSRSHSSARMHPSSSSRHGHYLPGQVRYTSHRLYPSPPRSILKTRPHRSTHRT